MYNCSIIINNNYLYYFDDITLYYNIIHILICRRVSITTYCTVVIKYTVYSVLSTYVQ